MGAKTQGEHPAEMNVVFKQKIRFLGVSLETTLPCKHHGHLGLSSLDVGLVCTAGVQLSLEVSSGNAEGHVYRETMVSLSQTSP